MPMIPPNVPNPDPSNLTMELVQREVSNLRQLLEIRINAIEKAADVFSEGLNRVPTVLDREIAKVFSLTAEKFASQQVQFTGVQLQFSERDVRSKASETAAQTGLTTALAAQKEQAAAYNDANAAAVTKSEAATVKQIDSILALLASNTKAIDEKIASINARLDRGEGGQASTRSNQATNIAIGALVVTVIVGGFSIVNGFSRNSQSAPQPAAVAVVPVTPQR